MKKKGIRSRLGVLPVKGHRDFNATACPGDRFPMSEIVASVENETESSVMNYQRANGLAIDGLVGDKTWGSLLL